MLFSALYKKFTRCRGLLFAVTLGVIAASAVLFLRIDMREDIGAMLPDRGSEAATDFRLLQQAPFARKVMVTVTAASGQQTDALLETVDRLADGMRNSLFTTVATGPANLDKSRLLPWLLDSLPSLASEKDLVRIQQELTSKQINAHLQENKEQLISPEGWLLKGMIQRDPLNLRSLCLEKLRPLNLVPGLRLEKDHFLSADGRSALLIAETSISITDSEGSRLLLDAFDELVRSNVPDGMDVSFVSGHRYTLANADAIKGDLYKILSFASIALILIFALFLRSWRALFVFLVPVSVLCFSAVAVSLYTPTVSAVTIGFGGVLLGITVDFALHVYFAFRRDNGRPERILGEVARPILFGGLTTIGAFAVLLFSDLPGQRQLAVFSMSGIAASLLVSLVVLPHLLPRTASSYNRVLRRKNHSPLPRWVLLVWGPVMVISVVFAGDLKINGDLRAMSLVPDAIHADEERTHQVWGNLRGQALLFSEGASLEEALEGNERLYRRLVETDPNRPVVSLAPLLPSQASQNRNREQWREFWRTQNHEGFWDVLQGTGDELGFSHTAFLPFLESLETVPADLAPEALRQAGFSELVDSMILQDESGFRILTMVPDSPQLVAALSEAGTRLNGVRLVSPSRFRQEVGEAISRDFTRFIVSASVAVLFLLIVLFRRLRQVLLALLPVASGLACMFGGMGALGLEFNLFNIVATILIIGLGVDYGIFMVCRISEGYDHGTGQAVFVSGLTTLAGFGSLVMASHPALYSIGVTVLLGIGGAIPTALFVLPALSRQRRAF